MAEGSPMVIVGGVCFLLAALAYTWNWRVGAWLGAAGAVILAGALAARGVSPGDRVAAWLPNAIYFFTTAVLLLRAE